MWQVPVNPGSPACLQHCFSFILHCRALICWFALYLHAFHLLCDSTLLMRQVPVDPGSPASLLLYLTSYLHCRVFINGFIFIIAHFNSIHLHICGRLWLTPEPLHCHFTSPSIVLHPFFAPLHCIVMFSHCMAAGVGLTRFPCPR